MKKFGFIVTTLAVALVFAAPSFAGSTKDKADHCKGTITVIDGAKGSVKVINSEGKEKTFIVPDKIQITTADKSDATLADLKVGDTVKVTFTTSAFKHTATKIQFLSADKVKTTAPSPTAK